MGKQVGAGESDECLITPTSTGERALISSHTNTHILVLVRTFRGIITIPADL